MDTLNGVGIAIILLILLMVVGNCIIYKKLAAAKSVSFRISLAPVLVLISAPLLLIGLPIFAIFRQMVNLILFIKYDSKYCGLLDGRDAVYNYENKNPGILLFMIKYDSTRPQSFYNYLKENVYSTLRLNPNPKIFGAVRTFLGYSYLLRDEIKFHDCFQRLEFSRIPKNREELMESLSKYTSLPLPKNDESLWDVFVGTKPVNWSKDTKICEEQYYPVLLRVNHTFTDAQHLTKGIIKLFGDSNSSAFIQQSKIDASIDSQLLSVPPALRFFNNLGRRLIIYTRQLCFISVAASVGLVNSLLMVDELNILHGPKPTYKKHLFLNIEESSRYIQLVRNIKRKFSGCTFEDVCLTAIAAGFHEYFQKNSTNVPEYLTVEVPAVPLTLIMPEKPKGKEVFCRNRLTFAVRRLPIRYDTKPSKTPLTELLKKIIASRSNIKQSIEHEANYMILKLLCHFVPATILRPYFDTVHNCSALISNFPGPGLLTIMEGCKVHEWMGWAANRGYTGVGLLIHTYNGRFQTTLVIDECLATTRSEARSLIDGFFKYLDLLEQEITNFSI